MRDEHTSPNIAAIAARLMRHYDADVRAIAASALTQAPDRAPAVGVAAEVIAERFRQIESKGWSRPHDDQHSKGEIALAAGAYAVHAAALLNPGSSLQHLSELLWPWPPSGWKPASPSYDERPCRRDLVRAAALIVAEIERLDRAEAEAAANG